MHFIEIKHIYKSFGTTQALKNINFSVDKGELFGLIGPDGAGKTSLFRLFTTLLLADSGTITLDGADVVKSYRKIRKKVGYMPGRFSLYQDLSVEENLQFFATIFKTSIEENYDLIKPIYSQIESFKKRRAGNLSGGMKQKLALSCALIHKPKILFLDEPTTGVDAVSRKEFWEILSELKIKGITILVSTPYMDEAGLCDRVALIQKGEILSIDNPKEIEKQFSKTLYTIKTANIYKLIKDLENSPYTHSVFPFGQFVHYIDIRENILTDEIVKYLKQQKHSDIKIEIINANIEDCFMELMNKPMEETKACVRIKK
jgi:ABC-type multidrug transport system ATPase subunit